MAQLDYGTSGRHGISYSRQETLHVCERKFEIENVLGLKARHDTVTFSYGHAVAAGVQEWFRTQDYDRAVLACTLAYTYAWSDPGTASEQRAKKSVWHAVWAVHIFIEQIQKDTKELVLGGLAALQDYELAIMADGSPAIEVQFRILLDKDYVYEGHIDLILRHKVTGHFAILELKTTSFRDPHPAMYANSNQALSYSVVLDKAVGSKQASYKVFYAVFSSSAGRWHTFDFVKSAQRRVNWINDLIRTTEYIEYLHEGSELGLPYPMKGSGCYSFFRPCEYYQLCDSDNDTIVRMLGGAAGDTSPSTSFDYTDRATLVFTIAEIVDEQLTRIEDSGYELQLIPTEDNNDGELIFT